MPRHARQEPGANDGHPQDAPSGRGNATLRRYVLWQLPGWLVGAALLAVVVIAMELPWWVVVAGVAVLVVRDVALYPVMRATFRPSASPKPIGARGVTVDALNPEGLVRVGAELWRAHAIGGAIPADTGVVVTGARGLTLIVEPAARRTSS